MRLITARAPRTGSPAVALDVAIAQAMLRLASAGEIGPTLRISRPRSPGVAFGRIDLRRDGFDAAAVLCREAGFEPVVRSVGGRAAAYTEDALVLDHVAPAAEPGRDMHRRFEEYGDLVAGVLVGLGVDARVGEVPGEFCPGAYSVNARGVVKLAGTAQRVVRGAWLFSIVLVVDGADRLRTLLPPLYEHLGLPFDPAALGSVAEEAPGVDVDVLAAACAAACAQQTGLEPADLDDAIVDRAVALLDEHTVAG